jgi:hypothetical protein
VRGSNDRGDIAIDDISFAESFCGIYPPEVLDEFTTTTATTRTTVTRTTTTVRPPNDEINCNFDQNYKCGWSDDPTAELQWTLNKGSTSSLDTGPSTDVSGTGYYIYLETSGVKKGDKARLLSPLINNSLAQNTRMSFKINC